MSPEERRRKLEEIAQRLVERLEQRWPGEEADINELEDVAAEAGRELIQEITEEMLREQAERPSGNQSACPHCSRVARFRSRPAATIVTWNGRLSVKRAYYYCSHCRRGHCPCDWQWRLGPGRTTPTVQALVAALAADVPYVQVPRMLARFAPAISLDVATVERITVPVAAQVAARTPALPLEPGGEGRLAVAVDGVMLPTRNGYQEVRCGVVYAPVPVERKAALPGTPHQFRESPPSSAAAAGAPAATPPETDPERSRPEFFGSLLDRKALVAEACARVNARRTRPIQRVAALGDGAAWIWSGYAQHLPCREEILDFYHALEHVAQVAEAWHGIDSPASRRWYAEMKEALLRDGPTRLLRQVYSWAPATTAGKQLRNRELNYFRRNRRRMDYPRFLKEGWPIGSGAVESACKQLITARFKRAGMRWKRRTAEPLIQLRAALLTQPTLDLRPYVPAPTPTRLA